MSRAREAGSSGRPGSACCTNDSLHAQGDDEQNWSAGMNKGPSATGVNESSGATSVNKSPGATGVNKSPGATGVPPIDNGVIHDQSAGKKISSTVQFHHGTRRTRPPQDANENQCAIEPTVTVHTAHEHTELEGKRADKSIGVITDNLLRQASNAQSRLSYECPCGKGCTHLINVSPQNQGKDRTSSTGETIENVQTQPTKGESQNIKKRLRNYKEDCAEDDVGKDDHLQGAAAKIDDERQLHCTQEIENEESTEKLKDSENITKLDVEQQTQDYVGKSNKDNSYERTNLSSAEEISSTDHAKQIKSEQLNVREPMNSLDYHQKNCMRNSLKVGKDLIEAGAGSIQDTPKESYGLANHQVSRNSNNLLVVGQITVQVGDWLKEKEGGSRILQNIIRIGNHQVHFDDQKKELSGKMVDLLNMRKEFDKEVNIQDFNISEVTLPVAPDRKRKRENNTFKRDANESSAKQTEKLPNDIAEHKSLDDDRKNEKLQGEQTDADRKGMQLKITKQYSASVELDANIYSYISSMFTSKLDLINKNNNLKVIRSAKEQGSIIILNIQANNVKNLGKGISSYVELIDRVSQVQYVIPSKYANIVNAETLDSKIQSFGTKDVLLTLNDAQSGWTIIGSMREVENMEKRIANFVKKNIEANKGRKDRSSVVSTQPQTHHTGLPINSGTSAQSKCTFNASLFSRISLDPLSFVLTVSDSNHRIIVSVKCIDMLDKFHDGTLPDAIVSPCDMELKCPKGMSKAIMDAAGKEVRTMCTSEVQKGNIEMTKHFVTHGGKMKHQELKYIMHAVGPNPDLCNNNMDMIQEMTRCTYYNCLMATTSIKIRSIALPLLGVGKHVNRCCIFNIGISTPLGCIYSTVGSDTLQTQNIQHLPEMRGSKPLQQTRHLRRGDREAIALEFQLKKILNTKFNRENKVFCTE